MLHMDVFIQRLEQEYGASVIATHPTVPYKGSVQADTTNPAVCLGCTHVCSLRLRGDAAAAVVYPDGKETILKNPAEFPEIGVIPGMKFQEPMVNALLTFPQEYIGPLLTVCEVRRAPWPTRTKTAAVNAYARHPAWREPKKTRHRSGAASSWR